jgi:AcrR family transcriptional regulator
MDRMDGKTGGRPVGSWGEREEGILDVAQALFRREGYDAVSMAMVARQAGLSEGTLYNYFSDKRDLVLRVGGRIMAQIVADAERVVRDAPSLREGLEGLIAIQFRIVLEDKELYRMLLREVRADKTYSRADNRSMFRAYTDVFFALIDKWRPDAATHSPLSLPMMRDLVYGGTEHVAWNAILREREHAIDVPATARIVADILLKGLGLDD